MKRRDFFARSGYLAGAVVLTQLGVFSSVKPALAHSSSKPDEADAAPKLLTAGKVDDYAVNSSKYFEDNKFFLTCLADGGFLALSASCTHFGCKVKWQEDSKSFKCPCHGSVFDIEGKVTHKPAKRPLNYFPMSIGEDQTITVDVSKSIKREAFAPEQVTYAKK